jgi:hypothetical protein
LKKSKIETGNESTPSPELAQKWLIKSEPHKFSINDLRNKSNSTGCWDGVRNYQVSKIQHLDSLYCSRGNEGKKLYEKYENW